MGRTSNRFAATLALLLGVSLAVTSSLVTPARAMGQVDARMLRYPDVSATQIAFVYAGDIWVAPKEGGTAHRLSSPAGEEMFPRFSPDGRSIAFTGNYDGNPDVYVVPTSGGTPTRVTYHPDLDGLIDWAPDGQSLLFASTRRSGQQRFAQFYRVGIDGGLPERLPMEFAEFGAYTPDGSKVAFMMKEREFRNWKRYRGGTAPDIHLFDLETHESENLTDHSANDGSPMWYGDRLYFLSDRGTDQRFNIWAREPSGDVRQVTEFSDFDITLPAIGPDDIVFQAGGRLYRMELATETTVEVDIEVVTDFADLKPRLENVAGLVMGDGADVSGNPEAVGYHVSPSGARMVVEARGDIFTVPAEHGPVRNLTYSSGVADRHPSWSPDGRWIAYWSDATGEYELTVRPADGSGSARTVTSLGAGFRYTAVWAPNSEKVAFIDQEGLIRTVDIASGRVTEVVRSGAWLSHGPAADFSLNWSADSRWLAFALPTGVSGQAVHLHDSVDGVTHQVTSGYYVDRQPTFDPGGDYLYLFTGRSFAPSYSAVQGSWIYANTTQIAAIPLRNDVPSPVAPRTDEEPSAAGDDAGADDDPDTEGAAGQADGAPGAVEIDLDDMERRLVVLPIPAGRYVQLAAVEGKVVYRRLARTGSAPGSPTPIAWWDLEDREETTLADNAHRFMVAAGGDKVLLRRGTRFGIVPLAADQSISTPLRTSELMAPVDPRAEWRQIVTDAWRLQRDYFYDREMHGLDWPAIRDQYLPLIDDAVTRSDVNVVIGEMIAELNASHTYHGGGDLESGQSRSVGLLGVDWALEDGAYQIERIVRGAAWDAEVRSPFDQPGVDVSEGDFVIAVNGVPLDPTREPAAALQGLAGRAVTITVSGEASGTDPRHVVVEPLASEARLRHLEWIEANRRRVEELSGGRVGYVYVADTGTGGQSELVRQFFAQRGHDALIVDERFNSGGQIPDRFVELLNRPALASFAPREGAPVTFPVTAHRGPKVMLMNGWSGSGGDAFPDYFRKAGLGPLIGTRTWGGLIGISGNPVLVDGGVVTVPSFRMFDADGEWFAEGHGVDPDIEVPEDVTALAAGRDPQIERAVEELLRALATRPVVAPQVPAVEDRSRGAGAGS